MAHGNTLTTTDGDGNVTTDTYTGDLLVGVEVRDAASVLVRSESFAYDEDGNQISSTDGDGQVIVSVYTGNELTGQIWYNATGTVVNTLSWSYDDDGNMLSASNNEGTYTMTYEGKYLLTQTTPSGLTLTYAYDSDGNVLTIADSQGGLTTMTYGGLGQVLTKTYQDSSTQLRVDYTYDQDGNVLTETRYSDLAGTDKVGFTQYAYTGNLVTSIVHEDGSGGVLASYSYTYDAAGRLRSETEDGTTTDYTYDAAGQLTEAGSQTYSYDANGNPTGTGYDIGPDNELLSDGTWNYSYDTNGNLTQQVNIADGTTWTYGYNNVQQMVWAIETDASSTVLVQANYSYDVFGNRFNKTVIQGGITTTPQYVYTQDGMLYATLDASGTVQTRYVSDVTGLNHWEAQVTSSGVQWLLSDYQGSVREVVDNSGTVLDAIAYDVFGSITSETTPTLDVLTKFQGGMIDVETGQSWFKAREFNPITQRWDEIDPMGFAAGQSNLYEAEGNGPTNGTDPTGWTRKRFMVLQMLFMRRQQIRK